MHGNSDEKKCLPPCLMYSHTYSKAVTILCEFSVNPYRGFMKLFNAGLLFTAVCCSAFSVQAAGSDISWNYVAAGYAKTTIKNIGNNNVELDGYQVSASYLLSDNLYLHAAYNDVSGDLDLMDDILGMELEASELKAGLGVRQTVADNIDSFFEAGYVRSESAVVGFEKDTLSGFQAATGFRYRIVHNLELSAAVRYNDGSDSESSTVADINGRYRVTPMLDIYVGYQFDSDVSLFSTGLAINF
ncbi:MULTISPECIES: outer membrane beta-barrel protein [unclassified Arsukibacterium]|uniref:outer membrane beta-barrel protein n=1 Tax=unclassified Arsukibacterium TaxID=2635278 RepID=UPI000C4A0D8A|nr:MULTISPECIES: outer membrane beta-barrel protein [unclassified Arsukibacterium]MAA94402.1 hypothetical protein [Rheinheimera sp.]MBM33316.1 hypothetical protein [Rheinheimera sp.]HAW94130.1 hypothetical protein [Candidatus Azambacteria bacterium]|tara:strand:+ start:54653 stop:55384 length:732 start_codon:yes stop_codon:yes gene_type:complete